MWEKRRKHDNSGEVIQEGLKDTTDGIRENVLPAHDGTFNTFNVFFLAPPLSRHDTVKART